METWIWAESSLLLRNKWQRNKVREHTPQWTEYASIEFAFIESIGSS